jgi:hypothetical protein
VTRRYPSYAALRRATKGDWTCNDPGDDGATTLAEIRAVLRDGAALLSQDADADANERNAGSLGAANLPAPTEHDEQCALFAWRDANLAAHPELQMLISYPIGGYRPIKTAVRMKQEGAQRSIPDVALLVARGRWHSLWLELKRANRSNHATLSQREWIDRLRAYGHQALIVYGAQEAINAIMAYLAQDGGQP